MGVPWLRARFLSVTSSVSSAMLLCLQHLTNKVLWRLYSQPMNLHAAGSHIHSSPSQHQLPLPPITHVSERRQTGEAAKRVWCQVLCKQPPPETAQRTHTVSYPTLFPLRPTVLIIRPFLWHSLCYKKISEWRRSFEVEAIWMIFVNDAGARSLMGGRSNPEEKTAMLRAQLGALPPFTDFQLKLW